MIKVRDLVPEVYYNESRDFQTIGRVYEAVFNHLKTNVDIMGSLPISSGSDWHMLKLMASTLGFQGRREYDNDELRALCMSLIPILRLKGTKSSIYLAVNTMLNAHGIDDVPQIYIDETSDSFCYLIYISRRLKDTSLLEDLMDYILPAGFTYRLIDAKSGGEPYGIGISAKDEAKMQKFSSMSNGKGIGLISTPDNVGDIPFDGLESATSTSMGQANTITMPATSTASNEEGKGE